MVLRLRFFCWTSNEFIGRAYTDGAPRRIRPDNQEERLTTIYVTHDVTEIPFLSDRTVIMEGGKIIADGPIREVLREEMRGALSQLAGAANWLLSEDGGE